MKIRKYLLSILLIAICSIPAYAYTNLGSNFDKSLVQGVEYTYKEPRKILFTQINGRYNELGLSVKEFLDTVYYYSITKLKLGYLPFHYAIDESGNVYKTSEYDTIQVTDEPYLVVGYLSNNGQLTNQASRALLELSNDLSYKYGLTEYETHSYRILKSEDSFSKLTLSNSSKIFSDSIDKSLENWDTSKREHQEYSAQVLSVENSESVQIGNYLDVKVTVQNKNDFVWTSDKYPIYISTLEDKESIFAINEVWDSLSKVTNISSDKYVLPEGEITIEFKLDPKVLPGDYSEKFVLEKFDGEPFESSEFTVDFKVEKGKEDIVQITSPEAGYVNIRDCRRFSCKKVDVVNDGEVYPVVEYHESCWYKIKYSEDKEGWFYCPYAKEIE